MFLSSFFVFFSQFFRCVRWSTRFIICLDCKLYNRSSKFYQNITHLKTLHTGWTFFTVHYNYWWKYLLFVIFALHTLGMILGLETQFGETKLAYTSEQGIIQHNRNYSDNVVCWLFECMPFTLTQYFTRHIHSESSYSCQLPVDLSADLCFFLNLYVM